MTWFLITLHNALYDLLRWFDNFGYDISQPLHVIFFFIVILLFQIFLYFLIGLLLKQKTNLKRILFSTLSNTGFITFTTVLFFFSRNALYPGYPQPRFRTTENIHSTIFGLFALVTPLLFSYYFPKKYLPLSFLEELKVISGFIINMLTIGIFAISFFFFAIYKPCNQEWKYALMFNQHIKDLCYLREDTSECPQNEEQLRAFKPKLYDKLQQCAEINYYFDEKNQPILELTPYSKAIRGTWKGISFPNFTLKDEQLLENLE